ncbi:YafY family protein [Fodinicola feengrottensis]|uniref:YafY family protein n=1 Tax=Fodinicola feengrottensis TaxID=435914 RepID=A0ABP4TZP8_9ACTN
MRETSARLLRLLSLLQTRRDWSGADLAERLEVDVRTVRRDVDRLRGLGYPVNATPGVAGGYRLAAGASLPPLLLDDDEAVAVVIGLWTAASGTVMGMEETSVRALAKLEQVLPARLRQRVDALKSAVVPLPNLAPTVDADVLTAIASGCRDQVRLTFDYVAVLGRASVREIEPYRLVHTGSRWYLVAYDCQRRDWRTFRVDRIQAVPTTGSRFTPQEPPEDVSAYVSRSVSTAAYAYQTKILLYAPAAVIRAQVSATAGVVEPIDEDTCYLHAGANDLRFVPLHLARLGVDFEVVEPPELVEEIRAIAVRLTRATS